MVKSPTWTIHLKIHFANWHVETFFHLINETVFHLTYRISKHNRQPPNVDNRARGEGDWGSGTAIPGSSAKFSRKINHKGDEVTFRLVFLIPHVNFKVNFGLGAYARSYSFHITVSQLRFEVACL